METIQNETILKIKKVLSLWGIFEEDYKTKDEDLENLASMIVYRSNNELHDENKLIETIIEVLNDIYKDDMMYELFNDDINLVPLIAKLILEEDESKYLNIIENYKLYDNEIGRYDDKELIHFFNELHKAKSIAVFSDYKVRELGSNEYLLKRYAMSRCHKCDVFPLLRRYFANGHNVIERLYLCTNIDKYTASDLGKTMNMDEFYFKDKNIEGFINTSNGELRDFKNPYVIKEGKQTRFLKGYTAIDIKDKYDRGNYSVGLIYNYKGDIECYVDLSLINKEYEYSYEDSIKNMIKKLKGDNKNENK